MTDIISAATINKLLISLVIIILCMVLWRFLSRALNSLMKKDPQEGKLSSLINGQAGKTVYSLTKVLITLFAVMMVLQVNDINISSLITGLGVAGIVVGLAVQDILKDVIMGMHIVVDNFFREGDVIMYGDFEGRVEHFNLRTTTLRNVKDGSVITLCNSNINQAHKTSTMNDVVTALSYDADFRQIHKVFKEIEAEAAKIEGVEACKYLGTCEFADSSINYLLRFWCDQGKRYSIRLKILAIIQDRLDKEGLEIPFNQLDVHVDGVNQA